MILTLVVDEDARFRLFLKKTLQQMGHIVELAANGREALQWLRDTPFDLVMLEPELAGEIDGMRILRSAKWRWPNIVVIILTAHGSLESALEAIREDVDGYLLKPVSPHELREVVSETLARRRRTPTHTSMMA